MNPIDIQRIAVVNRGEPAVRFIRALREYNVERGTSIRSVALFTHADEGALCPNGGRCSAFGSCDGSRC